MLSMMSSYRLHIATIFYAIFFFSSSIISPTTCSRIGSECLVHFKDGDFILGGIIPIYRTINQSCDGPIMERHGVPKVETMAYAVEMINRRSDILPNITLGYEIRNDCREEDTTLWTTLTLADPCGDKTFQRQCPLRSRFNNRDRESRTVVGIIGPGSSATSLFVARAAAIFEVPTIAYSASSDELSDINRFPYFVRTVPPDSLQARVIIDLLLRYDWKYIALYFSMDSYGSNGAEQVRKLAYDKGICIAINTPIPTVVVETEWDDIVFDLNTSSNISVAVVFSLSVPASAFIGAISKRNHTRRITFIGSDDLAGNNVIDTGAGSIVHGSLFVRVHSHPNHNFRQYWNRLEDSNIKTSPWYQEFTDYWKNRHNCSRMASCPFPPVSESTVINGVIAFAYALDATISKSCQRTPSSCNATLNGQILRDNLLNVSFQTDDGIFAFNANGETSGTYDIMNLQKHDGKYVFKEIGQWNEGGFFNFEDIQWGPAEGANNETPISVCRETCKPGFISVPLEKRCCFGCSSCPNDSIVINKTVCQKCPFKQWPNMNFTQCEPLMPDYLDWNESAIVIIILCSCMGIMLTMLVAVEFIINRERPLIKATSRELSTIIMCGLLLSFMTPFVIAAPPSYSSCKISEIFTAFSFLLIFGPTSLKVIRIFRIFRSGKKSASRLQLISPSDQICLLSGLVFCSGKYRWLMLS
ncbi:metabotropic glutamate receptor 3-like [Amphiura filiformis]|uniref:metabotropic glutamate receptor 3-like n=1 Tax=Amphiura filiformis TaxID=82378 RepID=UPI003B21EBD4